MAITFNSFTLQDDNYIVSEINYRGGPKRAINGQKVTRRAGVKYTSNEFEERTISITGAIIASSTSELQDKIDDLFDNVVRQEEGNLTIETGRSIPAMVSKVEIEDPHYTQTYVPFGMEFVTLEPYFKGAQQIVDLTVAPNTSEHSFTLTISGSATIEPQITYIAPAGGGYTTTSGIIIKYLSTGQSITWSGMGGITTLAYGDTVLFDWVNQIITQNNANVDPTGVFAEWEPGERSFTVTFSGLQTGGTLQFAYQPRYY